MNLYLLCINDEVKQAFSPKPMTSFRSASKLSNYLVRAKIYPIERSAGSFKCSNKCCQVCENVNKTENFTSSVLIKTYKDNKCLIDLLTSKKCFKQYFGETTEIFCKRWINYKNARKFTRGESCMQQHLFENWLHRGCSCNIN